MLKKTMILFAMTALFAPGLIFSPQIAQGEMDWRIIKELDLKVSPLDIAPSADGRRLFILTQGEILVYAIPEARISDRIPVSKDFDRIAASPSPRADIVTLTSSTQKTFQMIMLEAVQKINVTGLPFKGPADAFVTIAVFTDYQ